MLTKVIDWLCWNRRQVKVERLFQRHPRRNVQQLFNDSYVEEVAVCRDLQILSDNGWHDVSVIMKLAEQSTITITTTSGHAVTGADEHIVFDDLLNEVKLGDINVGDFVQTKDGVELVTVVKKNTDVNSLFDVSVDSDTHRYYTNGILSHNSWIAGAFLLWFSIFNDDKHSLVVSNKEKNAKEMIHRVRYMYERLPNWIKPGVTADGWNKHSVAFENNSRIESQATTEDSGRGLSISLMFCLDGGNTVEVKDNVTGEVRTMTLQELYDVLT